MIIVWHDWRQRASCKGKADHTNNHEGTCDDSLGSINGWDITVANSCDCSNSIVEAWDVETHIVFCYIELKLAITSPVIWIVYAEVFLCEITLEAGSKNPNAGSYVAHNEED